MACDVYLDAREKQENADPTYATSEDGVWKTTGVVISTSMCLRWVSYLQVDQCAESCGAQGKEDLWTSAKVYDRRTRQNVLFHTMPVMIELMA